jgi:hypothetical protein
MIRPHSAALEPAEHFRTWGILLEFPLNHLVRGMVSGISNSRVSSA